jgi:hypothetical protein
MAYILPRMNLRYLHIRVFDRRARFVVSALEQMMAQWALEQVLI